MYYLYLSFFLFYGCFLFSDTTSFRKIFLINNCLHSICFKDKQIFLRQKVELDHDLILDELYSNEISFLLLQLLKKEDWHSKKIENLLDSSKLEFLKDEFLQLTYDDQIALLENLCFPVKKAKECFQIFLKTEMFPYHLFSQLSPLGQIFLFFDILKYQKLNKDNVLLNSKIQECINWFITDNSKHNAVYIFFRNNKNIKNYSNEQLENIFLDFIKKLQNDNFLNHSHL